MRSADEWQLLLELQTHPEGGCFAESYRADLDLPQSALPPQFGGARSASTAIYFLLRRGQCSSFHRIRSDELWHFYDGGTLLVHVVARNGDYSRLRLGVDAARGDRPQLTVPAGCWFAAELAGESGPGFALVGCTVAPGFDFADFELADVPALSREFPQHADLVKRLAGKA